MPRDRRPRKCGGRGNKRALSEEFLLLIVRDRHGATTDAVLPSVSMAVKAVLNSILTRGALLCRRTADLQAGAKEEGFAR